MRHEKDIDIISNFPDNSLSYVNKKDYNDLMNHFLIQLLRRSTLRVSCLLMNWMRLVEQEYPTITSHTHE